MKPPIKSERSKMPPMIPPTTGPMGTLEESPEEEDVPLVEALAEERSVEQQESVEDKDAQFWRARDSDAKPVIDVHIYMSNHFINHL
jgi:hypothetical protein